MVRKTKQRDTIIKVLEQSARPLSLQEIFNSANKENSKLGIATVYRAIKDFLQSGKILKINLPGTDHRYQLKSNEHFHHFWCRVCEKFLGYQAVLGN